MKKILYISPDSYPMHGAESIVNLKLLRAMTRSGQFSIDLISKRNKNQQYGENSLSELGIKLNSLNIVEVDNKINLKTIWGHLMCFLRFGIVFKGSHWAYSALQVAELMFKSCKYDYVLTKSLAAPLLGYYLKRKYGIKWVATWNDPYPDCLYPDIYAKMFGAEYDMASKALIRVIHKYPDVHIFPSVRLRDHLMPFFRINEKNTAIIPHVVNIEEGNIESIYLPKDNTLRIIHSGNITYPRDPLVFMKGMKMFLKKHPTSKIAIDILGKADDNLNNVVISMGLEGIVRVIPPVSYIESLELLKEYHVALVIEAKLDVGIFLPTKVSDFMQERKAIFAISPNEGVLHDLYKNGNIGYFADNTDPLSVCLELEKLYHDYSNQAIVPCKIPYEYTEEYVVGKYLSF